MTKRLLLTLSLGAALAIIAAGTATSVTVGGVQVDAPTDGVLPQCANLNDDDGDGLVDLADPDCTDPLDTSEFNDPPSGGGSGGGSGGRAAPTAPRADPADRARRARGRSAAPPSRAPPSRAPRKGAGGDAPTKGLFGKQKGAGKGTKEIAAAERQKIIQPTLRNPDGTPTDQNPGLTIATFGPAPIGVPNPVIDSFEIPPFLLPIYQSCGTEYGIPWQVLASINRIETAFGTNLNVSSCGRDGLDAVHPLHLAGLRGGREQRPEEGPV